MDLKCMFLVVNMQMKRGLENEQEGMGFFLGKLHLE